MNLVLVCLVTDREKILDVDSAALVGMQLHLEVTGLLCSPI